MKERKANRVVSRVLVAAVCTLACTGGAWALSDELMFRDMQFNFINPGARSLGMGGAFTAVADDVTASQANPGGLHYISTPEFFFEYRVIENDPRISSSSFGSLEIDPVSGTRELPYLGVTSASETETITAPTFVSFAWPFELGSSGRRLTLAGSRYVALYDRRSLATAEADNEVRFSFDTFPNTVNEGRLEPYSIAGVTTGDSFTEIVYWNVAGSLDLSRDFSLGVTMSYATLELEAESVSRIQDPMGLYVDSSHPRLAVQPDADLYRSTIQDSGTDLTYTVGLHWHPDSAFSGKLSPWRFGAVYRKGARFGVEQSTYLNEVLDKSFVNEIIVPDRYGLAVSYQPSPNWLFTVEYERIEYSDLLDGFQTGVDLLTSGRLADSGFQTDPDQTVEYTVDDGNVPRLGLEYSIPFANPQRKVAIWAGYFREPDGRIRMASFNSDDPAVNEAYLQAFSGGEELDHFTLGAGFRAGHSFFQFAGDMSDAGYEVVGSFIYTF